MTEPPSRRTFLTILAAGAACGASIPFAGCSGPSGPIPAGNVSDLAVGDLLAVEGEAVAIGRDADGVYALTLVCTHAACDISKNGSVDGEEIHCDCHDSFFDGDGVYLEGPANGDLVNFAVEMDDDGELVIDADTVVDTGSRLSV